MFKLSFKRKYKEVMVLKVSSICSLVKMTSIKLVKMYVCLIRQSHDCKWVWSKGDDFYVMVTDNFHF